MLLFWRKNRLKVKAIRQKDSTDNKVKYLPISFLLESLDKVRDEFPNIFSYEVKKFSKWVPNYAEGASILINYKDKDLFCNLTSNLIKTYINDYEFDFGCNRYEWEVF